MTHNVTILLSLLFYTNMFSYLHELSNTKQVECLKYIICLVSDNLVLCFKVIH